MKKFIIPIISVVLICCCLVGTTYAWIVAKADPIINTFTAGNINISLSDTTTGNMTMVPGARLSENSKAIVNAGSEDCWLFVKIHKSHSFDTFMSYMIADGWEPLIEGTDDGSDADLTNDYDVYYRMVLHSDSDQSFKILRPESGTTGGEILVNPEVTKAQLDTVNTQNYPTLTFTAYAVQRLLFGTAADAWVEAVKLG